MREPNISAVGRLTQDILEYSGRVCGDKYVKSACQPPPEALVVRDLARCAPAMLND